MCIQAILVEFDRRAVVQQSKSTEGLLQNREKNLLIDPASTLKGKLVLTKTLTLQQFW